MLFNNEGKSQAGDLDGRTVRVMEDSLVQGTKGGLSGQGAS